MPNQDWFNEAHYRDQKIAQMNTTGYTGRTGAAGQVWDADSYAAELAAWNVTSLQNFEACNSQGYESAITKADINISPNAFFDVPVYLQNVATYANTAANGGVWTDPDQPSFPAGGTWTAEGVLDYMVAKGISAWMHYTLEGMANGINPSNTFDTNAYLAARAQAMQAASGDTSVTARDALAAIQAEGINAIQDYYDYGVANKITAPAVSNPTTVSEPAGWTQWGTAAAPVVTDPYDVDYQDVAIEAGGDGTYTGAASQNTHFNANWGSNVSSRTLAATDVITGGENALNSLVIDLGAKWDGFKGVAVEGEKALAPNVTNVGRVVLNHEAKVSEQTFEFNAKNISADTVRYDLNNTGTGTFKLTELNDAVERVNISGIKTVEKGKTQPVTELKFANRANAAADDAITIGVNDVCADGKGAASVKFSDIENVTIDGMGGKSYVNLTTANGIENLKVTGDAYVAVTNSAAGIKSYDASETTGGVNFGVQGLTTQSVKGGSGTDGITFTTAANVTKADWTDIEQLTFNAGGSVNAKGVTGIEAIWLAGAPAATVTNLAAEDLKVYQNKAAATPSGTSTINGKDGSLVNLTWQTDGGTDGSNIKANFASNATGDINLNVTGKDTLAGASSFSFSDATGTITLKVPNAVDVSSGLKLVAPKATALDIAEFVGVVGFDSGSDLSSVENVTADLARDPETGVSNLNLGNVAMPDAQSIVINSDAGNVTLGNLGNGKDNPGIDIDINDAAQVEIGTIDTALGGNITVDIDATETATGMAGTIKLGNITTSTNAFGNAEGDVTLTLAGASVNASSAANIKGEDITIDASQVTGGVGTTSNYLALYASGSVNYTGAKGNDAIGIQAGAGTSSVNPGAGTDNVIMRSSALNSATDRADIYLDLADGAKGDTLSMYCGADAKGLTVVHVTAETSDHFSATAWSSATSPYTLGGLDSSTSPGAISQAVANFGLDAIIPDGVTFKGSDLSDDVNGARYWLGTSSTDFGPGKIDNAILVIWEEASA